MDQNSVLLFTRFGMGHGPESLQQTLVTKFLNLLLESGKYPAKILFYTDGVRLVCSGSPVLDQLQKLAGKGVELVLCKTCLDMFGLAGDVQVGIVGGMGDILTAIQMADRVISL